jgi:peptide/nickel transport system permease protein
VLRRAVRRLAHAALVVWTAATASFALLHLAPGDPVAATLDHPAVTAADRARLRARYGLDRPVAEQYARWLAAAARGDLGWSLAHRRPVAAVIGDALPYSALLVGTALTLATGAGVLLGTFAGWRPRHPAARALAAASVVLQATPEFLLALGLVSLLALRWALLPPGGAADPAADPLQPLAERLLDRLRHLALPATALALGWTGVFARHHRAAVADAAGDDFVRTARAKGVPESRVATRHALRPALAPTIALLGLALPALVGGALVTEAVCAWPGLGLVAARAVAARDYALVAGVVVAGSAAVAVGTWLAETLQAWADPRTRADGA